MARVSVVTGQSTGDSTTSIQWEPSPRPSLGTRLSATKGEELFLAVLILHKSTFSIPGRVVIRLSSSLTENPFSPGDEFSSEMELEGTITLTASSGQVLVLNGIGTSTEPYIWTPSNATAVTTFAAHVSGLMDDSLTILFDDNQADLFERVSGKYVPVELFERASGTYKRADLFERVGGTYTR